MNARTRNILRKTSATIIGVALALFAGNLPDIPGANVTRMGTGIFFFAALAGCWLWIVVWPHLPRHLQMRAEPSSG